MEYKFKDVAGEAGFSRDKYGLYWDMDSNADGVDLDKFAELIVKECTAVIADAVDRREPASTYVDKILNHFQL